MKLFSTRLQSMTFTPIFLALFALWPILAVLGGQGFSAFVLLGGILAVPFWRPKWQNMSVIGLGLFAFLGWALITSQWSPYDTPLFTGSLAEQNSAIKSGALRLGLLAILGVLFLNAMQPALTAPKRWWGPYIFTIFSLHGAAAIIGGMIFWCYFSALTSPEDIKRASSTLQNFTRSLNSFAFVIPISMAFAATQKKHARPMWLGVSALILGTVITAYFLGALGALLAVASGIVGYSLTRFNIKFAVNLFFLGLVITTFFMPLLMIGLLNLPEELIANLPYSAQARIYTWTSTAQMVFQEPWLGHGLDASRTWTQTYGMRPELAQRLPEFWADYAIIAGHPHNMPLHIWAETGLLGICLFILCLWVIYVKIRKTLVDTPFAAPALIGLLFAFAPIFLTSYGMWNDAFWAGVFLMVVAIGLMRPTDLQEATPQDRDMVT